MIIYAPNYEKVHKPIFLAGPIQGAPNWHDEAIKIITNIDNNIDISVPKRKDGLVKHNFNYSEQVDWETYYLNKSASSGVILFWLANENEHICERAYAQTTRFELAEWWTRKSITNSINIVIGIEPGFSGEKYLRHKIKNIQIFNNLNDTCIEAIKIIKNV